MTHNYELFTINEPSETNHHWGPLHAGSDFQKIFMMDPAFGTPSLYTS